MNISRTRAPFLLAAAALLFVVGACGDDDPKPDPQAEIRVFHAAAELGRIDVTIDDTTVQVDRDSLSNVIRVDPGPITITVANTGAATSLFEKPATVDAGQHVYVISGTQTTLGAEEIGLNRPELAEGEAAFQVVSVVSSDQTIDAYFGPDTEPQAISRTGQSSFVKVDPSTARLTIRAGGSAPDSFALLTVNTAKLNFVSGGIYSVFIATDTESGELVETVARLQ